MIKKKKNQKEQKSVILYIEIINPLFSHPDRRRLEVLIHGDVEI